MSFDFANLDSETRKFMQEEITSAHRDGNLYFSKRFAPSAKDAWPELLMEAASSHDEHWLGWCIESLGLMVGVEGSRTPSGGYTIKHVPSTAAETLAEGQFNRYYILGVCRRAVGEKRNVVVYRAKAVSAPRPESDAMVGRHLDPATVIESLRSVQSSLKSELLKPNSGLSVCLED